MTVCAACGREISKTNFARALGQPVHRLPCFKLWKACGFPTTKNDRAPDWEKVFRRDGKCLG